MKLPIQFCLFALPSLVLVANHEHFMRVKQVSQRVGSIPHLMLPPHARDYGRVEIRVVVRGLGGDPVYFINWRKGESFPPKKSAAPHLMAS